MTVKLKKGPVCNAEYPVLTYPKLSTVENLVMSPEVCSEVAPIIGVALGQLPFKSGSPNYRDLPVFPKATASLGCPRSFLQTPSDFLHSRLPSTCAPQKHQVIPMPT